MKKILVIAIWSVAFLADGALYAQKHPPQKSSFSRSSVESAVRGIHSDEKREELSKKLLQRKNELRREEHERERPTQHHNSEIKEKDQK